MQINQVFKCKTVRPADNADVVSIAELAKFIEFSKTNYTLVSSAYDEIRTEYRFEIDEDSPKYFVDWKTATAVFKDGSTLTFSERK